MPTVSDPQRSRALVIVSDTTPISELAKVGRVTLLREVYGRVLIPEEVETELNAETHPAVAALNSANWIVVHPVVDTGKVLALRAATRLGLGECAAITLAEELGADRLLMDDRAARREARVRGLHLVGTVGVLLIAKRRGVIPQVKQVLDELISHGTRLGQRLYHDTLALAGESSP